jgi:hypothetical protein
LLRLLLIGASFSPKVKSSPMALPAMSSYIRQYLLLRSRRSSLHLLF